MSATLRCIAFALLGLPLAIRAADDTMPCGKNHYILEFPCVGETAPMHAARMSHTATLLIDGRVLVVGGGEDVEASAETYDPQTGSWSVVAPLHHNRFGHTATRLLDGRVLVVGGDVTWDDIGYLHIGSPAELFDPATGRWTEVFGPLTPRFWHSATLLADGTVLVAGGYGSGSDRSRGFVGSAEIFDPATSRWTPAGEFKARWGHTAVRLDDGRVLALGGMDSSLSSSVDIYDPQTRTWAPVASLPGLRSSQAVRVPNGQVLLAGLDDGSPPELYDPVADRWTELPPPLAPAWGGYTLTLLMDGSVLAVGGAVGSATEESPAVERFDIGFGGWQADGTLVGPRVGHTTTLLGDGSVLVAGGGAPTFQGVQEPTRSAVRFVPAPSAR
jgi:hypothetical protein